MDGHPSGVGNAPVDRIPPTGRLTVDNPVAQLDLCRHHCQRRWGLQNLDLTSWAGGAGQTTISSEQHAVSGFGDSDVTAVVGGEICTQFPHPWQEGRCGEHRDWDHEQVTERRICLLGGQLAAVGVPSEDRGDLDSQEIWADDRLAAETGPEALSVGPAVC